MKSQMFRAPGRALQPRAWPLPALVLLVLAASPFLYRAWQAPRAVHVTKVALLAAFSGQLQARGNDVAAAAQLAIAAANARPAAGGRLAMLTALDDQGRPGPSDAMARTAAADPGVSAVLCCTTQAAYAAAAPLLPKRETLLSLLPAADTATAEAALAARQFGAGSLALVSAVADPADSRAAVLAPAFSRAGFAVQTYRVDFTAGDTADKAAAVIAASAPRLVALDADYPSAAVVAAALRSAGVTAPLLGDDRLDGAPAAALLANAAPWWYVAPDRAALLKQTPPAFAADFAQQRGHAPSARDLLTYLQVEDALGLRKTAPVDAGAPMVLYEAAPGQYPGAARLAVGASGVVAP